jgi:predicted ATPase
VGGEVVWPVAPLEVPTAGAMGSLAEVAAGEAVTLFVVRATAAQPDFRLAEENMAAVAEVCRRLDGLPLAIEMAAARVHSLPPAELAARLDDRFRLLTSGDRTAPPRHQTLHAAIDWSYDLLGAEEQTLLRRVSVFAGGWTLSAAEAVCAGEGLTRPALVPTLLRLVDHSLVVVERSAGEARYRLLETVRQYAAERLEEAGEEATVRHRHLAWCLTLAEAAEPALFGADQMAWFAWLDAEQDNLRMALAWSLVADGPDHPSDGPTLQAGLRLAGVLAQYWFVRAPWSEAASWYDRLLARSQGNVTVRARRCSVRLAGSRRSIRSTPSAAGR